MRDADNTSLRATLTSCARADGLAMPVSVVRATHFGADKVPGSRSVQGGRPLSHRRFGASATGNGVDAVAKFRSPAVSVSTRPPGSLDRLWSA